MRNEDIGVNIIHGTTSTLQLTNLQRDSGGVYTCKVSNALGFSRLEFHVNIQSKCISM